MIKILQARLIKGDTETKKLAIWVLNNLINNSQADYQYVCKRSNIINNVMKAAREGTIDV